MSWADGTDPTVNALERIATALERMADAVDNCEMRQTEDTHWEYSPRTALTTGGKFAGSLCGDESLPIEG